MVKIATWNINSVRLRIDIVIQLLAQKNIDVLCLQETKCPDAAFPEAALKDAGYEHIARRGQPGYNGVAIISRIPLLDVDHQLYCGLEDTRHISARLDIGSCPRLHSFYIPAGGDVPDPEVNEKFRHKLKFVEEMTGLYGKTALARNEPAILTGDFNIAPLEHDVWSHKQLLKIVSHTPVETEALTKLQDAGNWVDVIRQRDPEPNKLYSWWSYRARDWDQADKGRRLDHIWCDEKTAANCVETEILREARGWGKPSDHAPVIASFDL